MFNAVSGRFINQFYAFAPEYNGGVNVGKADGSVSFITDTVANQIWWAMGTRNGGETVSDDN